MDDAARGGAGRRWLRRLAPWLITAGVLAFILREYSPSEIAQEMGRGSVAGMIPFALLGGIGGLALMTACDALVLRAALAGPPFRDLVRGKAGSAMLMAIGYGFGHGGYGIWLAKHTPADRRTTAGTVAYIMLSDLAAVAIIAAIALGFAGELLSQSTRRWLSLVAALVGGLLVAAPLAGPRLLPTRVADPRWLRAFSQVPARRYALSLVGRGANFALLIGVTWGAARAFGLNIPLAAMFAYLPLVMLVGSLPINVAGFGAVQAAWLVFEPWASGPQILAFQVLWQLMINLMLVARGLPFIRSVSRDIERA